MNQRNAWPMILLGLICSLALGLAAAQAQEDVYIIKHTEIFNKLRRSPVTFDHEQHVEALEAEGCGACHHGVDPKTGKRVYLPDEEEGCADCHTAAAHDQIPALREAYHGSCTVCHRQMSTILKPAKGPTTCGECHQAGAQGDPQ